MPQRPRFVNGEIYHVYNRGVEKRAVFVQTKDYVRFIHDLFEFNDQAPALNLHHYFTSSRASELPRNSKKPRKLLVDILCFTAMPNHYHLLLRQRVENGITEFMRKFGTGYTNYFNQKYDRVGALFQGKFKAVHVTSHAQLLYLPHYIHLNPLELYMPEWKHKKIQNIKDALRWLESYRWSSYSDYAGNKNFPSVTQRDFLHEIYGSRTSIDFMENTKEWAKSFHGIAEDMRDLLLET